MGRSFLEIAWLPVMCGCERTQECESVGDTNFCLPQKVVFSDLPENVYVLCYIKYSPPASSYAK